MDKPYSEIQISKNTFVRTFDSNVLESELVWHRDRENRIVESLENSDWMIQLDNQLPQKFIKGAKFNIPLGIYHRIIKGTDKLTVKIIKHINL